jgi:hypothetical protein
MARDHRGRIRACGDSHAVSALSVQRHDCFRRHLVGHSYVDNPRFIVAALVNLPPVMLVSTGNSIQRDQLVSVPGK